MITTNFNNQSIWTPNVKTGFLPGMAIPGPAFLVSSKNEDLQKIGSITDKLGSMSDQELEKFVSTLSGNTPDPSTISDAMSETIVRAYTNIAVHLIHRPYFAGRKELPSAIARPLWDFSERVGRQPSLTYASYVLANFIGTVHPRMLPDEFDIAQTPTGTKDEAWFVAAHLAVESTGGEVVEAIQTIEIALENGDNDTIVKALNIIESSMRFSAEIMPDVIKGMDPDIFLNQIRPLLHGHGEIIFRGVNENPAVTYIGETGAQSGVIRAVDTILNIQHKKETQDPMEKFLKCAPPPHQQYFGDIKVVGENLSLVKDPRVINARNAAAEALHKFRTSHMAAVAQYLPPGILKGTGSTNIKQFLGGLIKETKDIATPAPENEVSPHP